MGALPLALDLLLLLGGTVTLAYSGNRLVDSAAAIAEKARLTPAVIGLTVVAAGTSLPELLMILGAAGVVHPLQVDPPKLPEVEP
jgi:cation:H+ antiporter